MRSSGKKKICCPLRLKYTFIFAGLTAGVILFTVFINLVFLPRYYEYARLKVIRNVYDELLGTSEGSSFDEGTSLIADKLDDLSLKNNISMIILSDESDIVYVSQSGERDIDMILAGYILGQGNKPEMIHIIEETDAYSIRKITAMGNKYLEMYGRLDESYSFLLRTPLESIEESAVYANRLYLMIGLLGIIFSSVIVFLVSDSISKPILRLSDISEKMVNLDFEARYEGKDTGEIGLLGNNINKLSESLERSISDLKTANNELKRDIEKKEKAAEEHKEFISNVSHELKTPIALIQGYAEGLKEGVSDDSESREYYCDVIIDEASKMNNMVRQLLNLDQLENGDEVVELERFDISEVLKNYLQTAVVLAEKEGIEVRNEVENGVFVWGDPYKAELVISNYFSNAVHYCRENGGEKFIRIYTENHDKIVRVCVFNTGETIPDDAIGRIWDKFFKVDKARTREYGGSGVGLSIVKAIQSSIGMGYGVLNLDRGVVFWFELET